MEAAARPSLVTTALQPPLRSVALRAADRLGVRAAEPGGSPPAAGGPQLEIFPFGLGLPKASSPAHAIALIDAAVCERLPEGGAMSGAGVVLATRGAPPEPLFEDALRLALGMGPRPLPFQRRAGWVVRNSDELKTADEQLAGSLEAAKVPVPLARRVRVVALELMTNALYDAPRDPAGQPLFAHLSRTVPVSLPAGQEVRSELSFSEDQSLAELSVCDAYGSLDPELLIERFVRAKTPDRAVAETSGGAGLGLFFVLDAVDSLVVRIEPGRRTELWARLVFRQRDRLPTALCVCRARPLSGRPALSP